MTHNPDLKDIGFPAVAGATAPLRTKSLEEENAELRAKITALINYHVRPAAIKAAADVMDKLWGHEAIEEIARAALQAALKA